MAELKYWVWLSSVAHVGPVNETKLLEIYGSPEKIFYAEREELASFGFLKEENIDALTRRDLYRAVRIIDTSLDRGWSILTVRDAFYPERLRNIATPPLVLYVCGRLPAMDQEAAVAVVGTRRCTDYGARSAFQIGRELAQCGCVVVTGLARGIDSSSARGALDGGGKVVGVLGNGLDVVYPPENKSLYDRVAQNGALVSEYPPGSPPLSAHFPVRNRIVSGLSLGVTVIEAPERSGTFITANHALDQGRDVFVLPGNVNSYASKGTNRLLREGAIAVTCGLDIAAEYVNVFPDRVTLSIDPSASKEPAPREAESGTVDTAEPKPTPKQRPRRKRAVAAPKNESAPQTPPKKIPAALSVPEGMTQIEDAVCAVLKDGPLHIDEIIARTELPTADVMACLTMMEITGTVMSQTGNRFTLS